MTRQITETRRQTPWIAYGHFGFTHYFIEEELTEAGNRRFRHQWKHEDGTTRIDEWIHERGHELTLKV